MKDDSKAKNVYLGIYGSFFEDLRCHISRCATFSEEIVVIIDSVGHSEVNEDWSVGISLPSHHNIIQFNIAVEDSLGVKV